MEEEKNLPLQHNNAAAYCLENAYFFYFLLLFVFFMEYLHISWALVNSHAS